MAQVQIEAGALGREVAQAHFSRLYREHGRAILAYALRRVEHSEDAADVVAETFLVAWRRLGEVPPDADPLLGGLLEQSWAAARARGAVEQAAFLRAATGRSRHACGWPGSSARRRASPSGPVVRT